MIDPIAARHTAISATNYCELHVENATEEVKTAPKHKKNPDVGMKSVIFSKVVMLEKADAESVAEGEIVTLMDWGNVSFKTPVAPQSSTEAGPTSLGRRRR